MNKLDLIKRNSVEIINEKNLNKVLRKKQPVAYCGYEPSGEIHLGHLVTITKLMDLQKAGFKIKILFADWHAYLNQKGSWEFIKNQVKIWRSGFKAAGLHDAEFVIGTSFQRKKEYIEDVFNLASNTTLNRSLRSMQKVGRDIDHAKVSQVIYPFMQIVDMKYLGIDIAQSGIEQRKIHMLAVEKLSKLDFEIPVFVHTPLIDSLNDPGIKMSSSEPASFISIKDDEKTIRTKLKKAYCPEGKDNSILQIANLIIFPRIRKFKIERPETFGGNLEFTNFDNLEKEFYKKNIHPLDLKNSVGNYLVKIIGPIREKFRVS
jgi:tyrosyl-tRNA synthetase